LFGLFKLHTTDVKSYGPFRRYTIRTYVSVSTIGQFINLGEISVQ